MAPMDLVPELYKLSRRKQLSVRDDLQDNHWMVGLNRITDVETLDSLLNL